MKILCVLASPLFIAIGTLGFAQQTSTTTAADEAISLYKKKFSNKQLTRPFFADWGMSKRDISGAEFKVASGGTASGRGLFDVDEKRQRACFNELVKLYGVDQAIGMTRALPTILAFDRANFSGSLKAFSDIFGVEEAKAMVGRNPGLLAVTPAAAAKSDDQTMQFSYIISATRPFGPVLLPSLLGALSVPAVESISGIPIRANLFSSITGSTVSDAADALEKIAGFGLQ